MTDSISQRDLPAVDQRRYDLDWLRVIAFALLIFYHIGMFYVTWDWHVKSTHMSDAAELPMMLMNPWRLGLLFFISGVALRFALDKSRKSAGGEGIGGFTRRRFLRLFLPLVFGMAVIVAPQAYCELRFKGEIPSGFWAFYQNYISFSNAYSIITPTWNHLWYIAYLVVYTLIAISIAPVLRKISDMLSGSRAGLILVLATPIPFILYRFTLDPQFPTTHAMIDDWANHAHRLTIFLLGFVIAKSAGFWRAVDHARWPATVITALLGAMFVYVWPNWERFEDLGAVTDILRSLRNVYAWTFIVMLAAHAQRLLNSDGPRLRYFNNAIFCYFILHQTIIVVVGYWLGSKGLPVGLEFSLIMLATLGGSALGYEAARRIPVLGYLLGVGAAARITGR